MFELFVSCAAGLYDATHDILLHPPLPPIADIGILITNVLWMDDHTLGVRFMDRMQVGS